jgi:hypothetical protein
VPCRPNKAIEAAVLGKSLGEDELRCLEELGLAREGLLAPRPYLIYKALSLGIPLDLAKISRALTWEEFEEVVQYLLEGWGYSVYKHLRLDCGGKAAEFDVVGRSRDMALVAEIKHWKYGGSKWGEVARAHLEKTARCLDKLKALAPRVLPAVITMTSTNFISGGVPVISIVALRDFLARLDDFSDQVLILM